MIVRLVNLMVGTLLLPAVLAAHARADTGSSTNWAGYAVHHLGLRFNRVIGAWRQPAVRCVPGNATYSAMWVGLGGYSARSSALEQIGTEADCTASGRQSSGAWYEMVPAPSRDISMHVHPGDSMVAAVSVSGRTTTLALADVTRHEAVTKRMRPAALDVSSAEWIVEAPSECTTGGGCQTLPLADFGQAAFALAQARARSGHTGTISDRRWDTTEIRLDAGQSRRFVHYQGAGQAVGTAAPSALTAGGSVFSVTFAASPVSGPFSAPRAAASRAGAEHIVHPLR